MPYDNKHKPEVRRLADAKNFTSVPEGLVIQTEPLSALQKGATQTLHAVQKLLANTSLQWPSVTEEGDREPRNAYAQFYEYFFTRLNSVGLAVDRSSSLGRPIKYQLLLGARNALKSGLAEGKEFDQLAATLNSPVAKNLEPRIKAEALGDLQSFRSKVEELIAAIDKMESAAQETAKKSSKKSPVR